MSHNLPAIPPLPDDLRGADDVVSVREAYERGWADALHAAAEAIRAAERDPAIAQLERDQVVGDQRRGNHVVVNYGIEHCVQCGRRTRHEQITVYDEDGNVLSSESVCDDPVHHRVGGES